MPLVGLVWPVRGPCGSRLIETGGPLCRSRDEKSPGVKPGLFGDSMLGGEAQNAGLNSAGAYRNNGVLAAHCLDMLANVVSFGEVVQLELSR